ncbi:hypothetical protein GG804_11635 [Sphingomonas histidinilytica]|uniref:hypothetical protein n=1 Tax=Rhizorhabdus histidinilytica TaxID=439228 RepID=UPI001ADC92D7|nr:hypothetical protein [Rhizorhabdus histidinilytica]MBO9377420.1 hypothetical protein [Rhizorhabdus histidinilytica]
MAYQRPDILVDMHIALAGIFIPVESEGGGDRLLGCVVLGEIAPAISAAALVSDLEPSIVKQPHMYAAVIIAATRRENEQATHARPPLRCDR